MMMTQEQAFLKSRQQLQTLHAYVEEASSQGERIDKVERELFSQLLLIGHTLLESFGARAWAMRGRRCSRKAARSSVPRRCKSGGTCRSLANS